MKTPSASKGFTLIELLVVIVTHDERYIRDTDYILRLRDGKIGDVPFIVKTLDGLAELNVAGWG